GSHMSLLEYEAKFSELNPNRRHGNTSPHKIAMLLAVMDLIESGSLQENRIYFDRQLKDAFTKRFNELKSEADRDNPHLPYYHLHTSGFWHHQVNPGQRESYKTMSASGASAIDQHIAYAYLDEELFELLQNFTVRKLLTSALDRNFAITETSRKSILGSNNHW
uniref:SBDHga1 n=1 Tax=Hahella ganghwensis TaxID=286420 RepID=A0AAJ6N6B1_9GAMM|nr:Chain A, SBDHga1 [Hahella ganghwensis]8H0L_B Chain B, SBDHga1 [Hahella ganghwensis]